MSCIAARGTESLVFTENGTADACIRMDTEVHTAMLSGQTIYMYVCIHIDTLCYT